MSDTTLHAGSPDARRSTLSAIVAGAVIVLGLMIMFTLLGLAIGVTSLEALGQGFGIGAALYIVITQIISLAIGGFAAARFMAPRDTLAAALAGAAVWALTTLAVAFGGVSGGTSAISSSTSLVAQTAQSSVNAAQAVTPNDISLPDISEIAGSLSFADLPPELQQSLRQSNITPSQLRAELREAFRNVISQQEMSRARSILSATLTDIVRQPSSLTEEVNSALDRLLQGENAVISEEDLTAAVNTLQSSLNISDSEAQQLVEIVQSRFDEAVETLRQTVADLQDRLVNTINSVQSAVSSAALWLFIASLLGLVAAGMAGVAGTRVKRT